MLFLGTQGKEGLSRQKEQYGHRVRVRLGPQKVTLIKEAMGRVEGIFLGIRPEAPLILSWSIPAPRCKLDYKQNCTQYSPGFAVARLGMRTTVASVAAWGTKEGLRPALSCTFGQNLQLQFCGSIT